MMYVSFMKHSFKNYFAPDGMGGYKEVKRGECFAYDAESLKGKYPQRWYWDFENSFVIRLERGRDGEKMYNEARAERRRVLKAHLEQYGCVCKECPDCKGWDEVVGSDTKCDSCVNHVTFIALGDELDAHDGEKAVQFEICADADVERQTETNELLKTLHYVLLTFDHTDRVLWRFLALGERKKVIAAYFGWTLKQLEYRQLKLYIKLRSNEALKSFFEK